MKESYWKAMVAMKSTWSKGKRLFKKNFRRTMKMFRALVQSVAVWGGSMRLIYLLYRDERMGKIQRKYVKWILGLKKLTPNYILKEECKMVNKSLRGLE